MFPEPLWARSRKERSHHCPCRELNPGRPTLSLVSILTELSRLLRNRIQGQIIEASITFVFQDGASCNLPCSLLIIFFKTTPRNEIIDTLMVVRFRNSP
jgi:hypothetical protein